MRTFTVRPLKWLHTELGTYAEHEVGVLYHVIKTDGVYSLYLERFWKSTFVGHYRSKKAYKTAAQAHFEKELCAFLLKPSNIKRG